MVGLLVALGWRKRYSPDRAFPGKFARHNSESLPLRSGIPRRTLPTTAKPKERKFCVNNQMLGTIAMICAPALLVEGLLLRGGENPVITGIASMIFMAGWICSNTGMRRMRAAGTGRWGRAVLLVQLVGLVLAFLFGFFEATGLLGRESIIFSVTDAAWPLSMLWMLVVGGTVIAAGRLEGWKRFVPVLCPFWLLVAIGGSAALGEYGGHIGAGYSAVMWALLGLVVYGADRKRIAATPEPVAR